MRKTDQFGLDITTSSDQALSAWNKVIDAFLAHAASTPVHLGEALENDEHFCLALVAKGLFSLLLGRSELIEVAQQAHAQAQQSAAQNPVTERERSYIFALGAWLDGKPSASVKHIEAILSATPQDALAMKLSHAIRFMLGDKDGMRRSVERLLPAYRADHPAYGYLLGCYAFCLEENGEYQLAEAYGRRGLDYRTDDAWGLHAVAHVCDMTARPRDGIALLDRRQKSFIHCNNFRYHVWWHLALMHLELGNRDQVLSLYDTEIRADKTDDYRDISNATSLLIRLELEGIDVGDRWQELACICDNRTDDGQLAFADLHYMLALCGDKRQSSAEKLLSRIHADAERSRTEMDIVMREPGASAAQALMAFSEGSYRQAYAQFMAIRPKMQAVGGSHAQRDVFERIAIESALRAGEFEGAKLMIADRDERRGARDSFGQNRLDLISKTSQMPTRSSATSFGVV